MNNGRGNRTPVELFVQEILEMQEGGIAEAESI
jgi:hypothetical protein